MATAADHMLYIQDKVNPVLEQLVTQLLLERPEEPSAFMLAWLQEKHKESGFPSVNTTGESLDELKQTLADLQAKKSELESRLQ
mmetsp:Transcript_20772/g.52308  ORF Transcript_20772/g.52308 Transcript_20772/m.52308 type:complete len:84 (-) Transcript_20772:575-826(-)|eukprot:CAMPEP_0178993140 /NCGR_PEP_ID=MMETSP0795-20121207/6530_1 /TAXON_ID=88552 /ORGANISM="Amoebophrya sp., Strain Ameob2" /LENGTH=83 /DNA_ID=CAMNT_0020685151 /DNA_START=190 /DNA_END=441 /DNA_ORIENTATION=-